MDKWDMSLVVTKLLLDNLSDYRETVERLVFDGVRSNWSEDQFESWVEWFKIDRQTGDSNLGDWQSDFSRAIGATGIDRCVKRRLVEVGGSLLEDVKSVVGGLMSRNAGGAEAYGFNSCDGKITRGEFLYSHEICSSQYTFVLLYKNKKFYRLED